MSFRTAAFIAGVSALALAFPAAAQPSIEKSVKVPPGGLYEIVFNPADKDVYVAATGQRGVSGPQVVRVDGQTLTPEGAIDAADNGLFGLGLNSRTQTLYGTGTRTGKVSAIDLRTGKVVATVQDGEKAAHIRQVVVDEQRNKAYVTVVGGAADKADENPNLVWVIDGATNRLERKINIPTGRMTGAALDVAGNRLFVTGMGANEVVAVDLSNDQVVGRWPVGEGPTNLVYDDAGKRLFVVSQQSGDLSVLDAASGKLLKAVKTGEGALSVAVNPKVGQAYVANRGAGTVTVVDTKTYEVLANLKTGTFPQTIAIDQASNRVYVTNKARGLPRNAPAGTPVPEDPAGDTLTVIRP